MAEKKKMRFIIVIVFIKKNSVIQKLIISQYRTREIRETRLGNMKVQKYKILYFLRIYHYYFADGSKMVLSK